MPEPYFDKAIELLETELEIFPTLFELVIMRLEFDTKFKNEASVDTISS